MPTHAEQRVLPYTPEQLFALVADIERYPEFLPWCVGARVRERRPDLIVADLIIGFRMFRERFTSRVTLDPPHRIDVSYAEGPFKYLNNHWIFERTTGSSSGCRAAAGSTSSSISNSTRAFCSASPSSYSTRRCAAWWRPSSTGRSSSTAPPRPTRRAGRRFNFAKGTCSNRQ
jgi:ribosome-associated toxin RatA of RatAB toxin-antitoxin module